MTTSHEADALFGEAIDIGNVDTNTSATDTEIGDRDTTNNPFSYRHYDPVPADLVGGPPAVGQGWECNYFDPPIRRAWMFSFSVAAIPLALVIAATAFPTGAISSPYTIVVHIVAAVLLMIVAAAANIRSAGKTIGSKPIPNLPWVSEWVTRKSVEKQLELDNAVAEADEPVVQAADNSPGLLLKEWVYDQIGTDEDFIDSAGGTLSYDEYVLLVANDEGTWRDARVVAALARATGSRPAQWREVVDEFFGQ